jgi:hypothetical protein
MTERDHNSRRDIWTENRHVRLIVNEFSFLLGPRLVLKLAAANCVAGRPPCLQQDEDTTAPD